MPARLISSFAIFSIFESEYKAMINFLDRPPLGSIVDETSIAKLGKLSDEEGFLLAIILEHGMITKATWLSYACENRERFSHAMWSLTRRKLVVARPLFQGTMYFALSKHVVSALALPPTRAAAFNATAKLNAYARLLLFTQYMPDVVRIRKAQLTEQLGQSVSGLPSGFLGRRDNPNWLGFLRVDGHIKGMPIRSSRAIRDDVRRLIELEAIRAKLKQRQFGWVWITARQSRADLVLEQFKTFDVGKAPVTAVVIPELLSVIKGQKEGIKSN